MSCQYSFEIRKYVESFPLSKSATWTSGSSRKHRTNLTTPVMRNYVKEFRLQNKLTYDQWENTLDDLYRKTTPNVEEILIAGYMLGQYSEFRKQLPLTLLHTWIGNLEGWAEIDVTCQSAFSGKEVARRWDTEFRDFISHDLVCSPTISHQRASLVLLLRTLRELKDRKFLDAALSNVDRLKQSEDKLLTKAISWVLRTALKQHRELIYRYVEDNASVLPTIAVREFRKKYETGTK